jgi:hypothetical protein
MEYQSLGFIRPDVYKAKKVASFGINQKWPEKSILIFPWEPKPDDRTQDMENASLFPPITVNKKAGKCPRPGSWFLFSILSATASPAPPA